MAKRDQRQLHLHQLHPRTRSGRLRGASIVLKDCSRFQPFHASLPGSRTSKTSRPPELNASRHARRTDTHSSSVMNTCATLPCIGDEIGMQSFELCCSAGNPTNSVGRRFPFGDVQRGFSWVYASNLFSKRRETASKNTGSAPQVDDRLGVELVCQGDIGIKIPPIRTV